MKHINLNNLVYSKKHVKYPNLVFGISVILSLTIIICMLAYISYMN